MGVFVAFWGCGEATMRGRRPRVWRAGVRCRSPEQHKVRALTVEGETKRGAAEALEATMEQTKGTGGVDYNLGGSTMRRVAVPRRRWGALCAPRRSGMGVGSILVLPGPPEGSRDRCVRLLRRVLGCAGLPDAAGHALRCAVGRGLELAGATVRGLRAEH